MSANLSYTFQAMSSGWNPPARPIDKPLSKKPIISSGFQTQATGGGSLLSQSIAQGKPSSYVLKTKALPTESPKVLGDFDKMAEKVSDNTSNFWLALDVLEPMVINFQGVLSVKNGLLLSALVPIVNLPLQKGNRQLLSESPWGRITEFILTTVTWLPLLYSGAKEILTTTLDTYQQAKEKTGSQKTAQSHALNKGILETGLQAMALVIGPYALMNLSDFLIGDSFYRSRALFDLEGKTFPEMMGLIKKMPEFSHEHAFIEAHQLEQKSFAEIALIPDFIKQGKPKLSNEDGLVCKALFRRYQRGEMAASRFLPELGITLTKRIPIMVKDAFQQVPKVIRNEMPERIDSTHVLAQIGEILIKESTEKELATLNKLDRVKAYLKTQEFKLGSYKTMSSLALLAVWYLCLDPLINQLANALLVPMMVKHTNHQLMKKGEPPYTPPAPKQPK